MTHHRILQVCAFCAAVLSTNCLLQATPADKLELTAALAPDTLLVLRLAHIDKSLQAIETSKFADLFDQAAIDKIIAAASQAQKDESEDDETSEDSNPVNIFLKMEMRMGLTRAMLRTLFPGEALLAITEIDPAIIEQTGENPAEEPKVLFIVQHNGDLPTLQALLDSKALFNGEVPEGTRRNRIKEEFLGTNLTIIEDIDEDGNTSETGVIGLHPRFLIIGQNRQTVREALTRFHAGEPSLANDPAYLDTVSAQPNADMNVFFNLAPLMDIASAGLRKGLQQDPNEPPNPMVPTADALLAALRLDSFASFGMALAVESDSMLIFYSLKLNSRQGLASLLQYAPLSNWRPSYVTPDVVSANVGNFNLNQAFTNLEQLVFQVMPFAAMFYQNYLTQLQNQLGVNPREALIANFTGDYASIAKKQVINNAPDAPAQTDMPLQNVVALKIKDRASFETALEGLKNMFGGATLFQATPIANETLHALEGQQMGYVLTDDTLFLGFGGLDALRATISARSNSGPTLWNLPRFADLSSSFPANPVDIAYQDIELFAETIFNFIIQTQETNDPDSAAMLKTIYQSLPPIPLFVVAMTFFDENGLRVEARIKMKE